MNVFWVLLVLALLGALYVIFGRKGKQSDSSNSSDCGYNYWKEELAAPAVNDDTAEIRYNEGL